VATLNQLCVEWGVASRTLPGQIHSGDLSLVLRTDEGTLAAVVDGLGHGDEAEFASRTVVGVLEKYPNDHIISLIRRCHEALHGTRGAVMSIASFNAQDCVMTWLGVGNVEGILVRAYSKSVSEGLLLRGGVLGSALPPLQAAALPVATGDLLILATDGIGSGFARSVIGGASPQRIADRILREHSKPTDDSLVLVARFAAVKP
jgi:negative regulator of sigma-B (phosphoserine phosphatase)